MTLGWLGPRIGSSRWFSAAAVAATCTLILPAAAQEITLTGPLAGVDKGCASCPTEPGVAFTLHGMTGAIVADAHEMKVAPGSDAPDIAKDLTPQLNGNAAYIGSGLRVFYQGEYLRVGGTGGVFLVDRGLTELTGRTPEGYRMRADMSWGGHLEVFAGGQIDLRPVFPYLDVVGWLDIVQTRYKLHAETEGLLSNPAYNAYAFGVGPRLGIIIPISRNVYLDLAAAGGVLGMNRFMFTAGFGYTTGKRPTRQVKD